MLFQPKKYIAVLIMYIVNVLSTPKVQYAQSLCMHFTATKISSRAFTA